MSRSDTIGANIAIIFAIIALFFVCANLGMCTAPDRSASTLRKAGYTEIQTGGYDFFACGEDDTFSTSFTAKNPQGQKVTGTVCCGLIKNCTIRF